MSRQLSDEIAKVRAEIDTLNREARSLGITTKPSVSDEGKTIVEVLVQATKTRDELLAAIALKKSDTPAARAQKERDVIAATKAAIARADALMRPAAGTKASTTARAIKPPTTQAHVAPSITVAHVTSRRAQSAKSNDIHSQYNRITDARERARFREENAKALGLKR